MARIMLIGVGNVGSVLYSRITKETGHTVPYLLKSNGVCKDFNNKIDEIRNYPKYLEKVDAVCLAIPSTDDGECAFSYIWQSLQHGKPVITCEKGALSNFFDELSPSMDKVGCTATVGGGSMLLKFAKENANSGVREIHAVLNATLNYFLDEVSKDKNPEEVIANAKTLGYAEPGSHTPIDVLNNEACKDIPMKTAILFNSLGLGKMRAKDLKASKIDYYTFETLVKEAKDRRYVVSITRDAKDDDTIGGFKHKADGFHISGGFKKISQNNTYSQLIPSGIGNSILIIDDKKTCKTDGPGAGAVPTTDAMLLDLKKLLEK